MSAPRGEQTAAARWRRRAILACHALAGPEAVARLFTLSGPEAAACAAARPRALPADPALVFAIPIVGRHQVRDWQVVETALGRTLAAILSQQGDAQIRVMVCGQDRPATLRDDPRLTFLPFTAPVQGHDKVEKLRALARALPGLGLTSGLYLPFDGDDIPARDLALRAHAAPPGSSGLLVEAGLIRNVATGEIGRTAPRSLAAPGQKPFWKFCGSCAGFGFSLEAGDTRDLAFLEGLTAHEHRLYPYLARLAGLQLATLRGAPAVLYEINHGENFESRRGRGGFKQRFVSRFRIEEPQALEACARLFPQAAITG